MTSRRATRNAHNGDFEQSYAIPTERWLGLSRRVLAEQLKEDFSLRIKQSSLGCHDALKSQRFKLAKRDAAMDDSLTDSGSVVVRASRPGRRTDASTIPGRRYFTNLLS